MVQLRGIFIAIATGLSAFAFEANAFAQAACSSVPPQPASIDGADARIYKSISGNDLRLYIFRPSGAKRELSAPAVVFFFGGAWSLGDIRQFLPQAQELAKKGVVGILADYRVRCRHNSTPRDSVVDALDAIHYVRSHSTEIGVNPNRIVASGTSAGGHLAIGTAVFSDIGEVRDNVPSTPNALAIYSPGIDLTTPVIEKIVAQGFGTSVARGLSTISPMQNPTSRLPTLIQVGENDALTPASIAKDYCGRALEGGALCRVITYSTANHNFFFKEVEDGKWYAATTKQLFGFLKTIGFMKRN